MINQTFCWS